MLKQDPGLPERGGDQHDLSPVLDKRTVQGRNRDCRREDRLPAPSGNRQSSRGNVRLHGSTKEAALPVKQPQRFPSALPLGDPQRRLDIAIQVQLTRLPSLPSREKCVCCRDNPLGPPKPFPPRAVPYRGGWSITETS